MSRENEALAAIRRGGSFEDAAAISGMSVADVQDSWHLNRLGVERVAEQVIANGVLSEPLIESPSLPEAVGAYLAAQEALAMFELANPDESGKPWLDVLYARDNAYAAMKLAYAQVIP